MLPPGLRIPNVASSVMGMRDPFTLTDRCAKRFGAPYTMGLIGFPPIVVTYTASTRPIRPVRRSNTLTPSEGLLVRVAA